MEAIMQGTEIKNGLEKVIADQDSLVKANDRIDRERLQVEMEFNAAQSYHERIDVKGTPLSCGNWS